MQGFEVKFNVYANSQEEANEASMAIKQFISDFARRGIAVTASKMAEAVNRWKDNYWVTNYFR